MTAGKRFKRLVRERARRTGESYVTARRALRPEPEEAMTKEADLVVLEVAGVVMTNEPEKHPFLDLRERGGERRLSIFIGPAEAASIAFALGREALARPMTHDALKQTVDALGGRVVRIVIGHVPDRSTYTAAVTIDLPDGTERHFDWRPSDAVALAVRTEPRPNILVPSDLLDTPPPNLGGVYVLSCGCGASVSFRKSELSPVDDRPGHFAVDRPCPACGERVRANLAPPPAGGSSPP